MKAEAIIHPRVRVREHGGSTTVAFEVPGIADDKVTVAWATVSDLTDFTRPEVMEIYLTKLLGDIVNAIR